MAMVICMLVDNLNSASNNVSFDKEKTSINESDRRIIDIPDEILDQI